VLSPVLLILLKELLQQGYLQKWIHLPKDEFESSPLVMDSPVSKASANSAESNVQRTVPAKDHEDSAK
jgi:hypothetical protein